uniref:RNA-binding protein n=1 Tax=Thermofilum pendens TaxID=2269 RepID=A0A7C3SLJ2_THEPE
MPRPYMLKDFNLVVSTYRNRENDCIAELWYFARELGDKQLDASRTGLPALVVARTSLDPEYFASKARERVLENPWYFRYILKIVPIHVVVESSPEEISRAALALASSKLMPEETYKVEAKIRLSDLSRERVIDAIASQLKNKVDLTNPQKLIVVEVFGEVAGVAVIPPELVVSMERLRREARRAHAQSLGGKVEEGGAGA